MVRALFVMFFLPTVFIFIDTAQGVVGKSFQSKLYTLHPSGIVIKFGFRKMQTENVSFGVSIGPLGKFRSKHIVEMQYYKNRYVCKANNLLLQVTDCNFDNSGFKFVELTLKSGVFNLISRDGTKVFIH